MTADDQQHPGPHRRGRRLVVALAAVAVLLVALAIVGVPVPGALLRGVVERRASEAVGREVRVGSLGLVLGLRPRIVVEALRLPHAQADRPALLDAAEVVLEIDVPALLGRRIHVREARLRGVAVRLEPEPRPERPRREERGRERAPRGETPSPAWSLDVDRLAVDDVEVLRRVADAAEPVRTHLSSLRGRLRWEEAVSLSLEGSHEGIPFSVRAAGASLAELIEGAEGWPLQLDVGVAGGELSLRAKLATHGGGLRLEEIRGRAGPTSIAGRLAFEDLADRPRVTGRIALGEIPLVIPRRATARDEGESHPAFVPSADARRVAGGSPAGDGRAAPRTSAVRGRGASSAPVAPEPAAAGPGPLAAAVGALHGFETDLELTIERLAGVGPPIEDVALALRVSEGELEFPVALRVATIPLSGTLHLDDAPEGPGLAFSLRAEGSSVDALLAVLAPRGHVRGAFGSLSLELFGRGGDLATFLASLRARLRATEARLTYGAEQPRPLALEELDLTVDAHAPLRLEARGALLGVPLRAEASAGSLETVLAGETWPVSVTLRGAGATLELEGEGQGSGAARRVRASLRLRGDGLAALEPWVGPIPVADAPYAIRAAFEGTSEAVRLRIDEARLGATHLTGEVGSRKEDDRRIAFATLRIDDLDFGRAATPREPARPSPHRSAGAGAAATLDVPILPGGLRLADADFDLAVGSLRVGDLELEELHFGGAIREAHLPRADLGVRLGGLALAGTLSLDLRDAPHEGRFTLAAHAADVGGLLDRLGVASGLELRAGALGLSLRGEGATLAELLEGAELEARVDEGLWTVRDPLSGGEVAALSLERAVLTRGPDQPEIVLRAQGSLRGEPIALDLRMGKFSLLERTRDRLPLGLTLRTAGATLRVDTAVSLPVSRQELDLALRLEGERLDRASDLLGIGLPAVGPYLWTTRVNLTPDDYRLSELTLRVGASALRGSGFLDTRGERPRLELELTSDTLQLEDFERPASRAAPRDGAGVPPGEGVAPEEEAERGAGPPALFSPEGLQRLDGRLSVRVDRVLSSHEVLGRGVLAIALEAGHLRVDPFDLELPGGFVELRGELGDVDGKVEARLRIRSRRLDYGVLARRLDPETDMAGWISLDVDVAGTAPRLSELLAHADGHVDFFAAPQSIHTDVFDLWAVNVLRALLPRLDAGPRSRLNCVVARFRLEDGVMRERSLYLDTTQMMVTGTSTVDFRERTLHAALKPAPKKAQMLSLQSRVEVAGRFDDFRLRIPPREFVTTLVRLVTSVVRTPVERILRGSLPENGEATCRAAWQRGEKASAAAR